MLTIILVVYKTDKKKLKNILDKIKKNPIIIIDNSKNYDFSKFKISKKTKIIRSKNIGNGAGINLGLRNCKTPYALCLDLDTSFKKNFIEDFFKFSIKNKEFSIMIPNHGNIKSQKTLIEKYDEEGSIMLLNKNKLKKIGFFDEKIFLYFEEIDLFQRCKKNNLKVYLANDFKITHHRATSISSDLENINNLRAWHYMWSMFYFYKKNFGFFNALKKIYLIVLKDFLMMNFSLLFLNKKNFTYRLNRLYGAICSIFGLSSFKRP